MLLVALALPVTMKAVRAGRDAKCVSNLRQVFVGFQGYLNEFEGTFPPLQHEYDRAPFWFDLLKPYYRVEEVVRCPVLHKWQWQFGRDLIGYGYNGYWLGLYGVAHGQWPPTPEQADTGRYSRLWRKIDEVKNPAKCSLVGDTTRKPDGCYSCTMWWPNSYEEGVDPRHGDGGMVLFVDSHVQKMYKRQMNGDRPWDFCDRVREWYDPLWPRQP